MSNPDDMRKGEKLARWIKLQYYGEVDTVPNGIETYLLMMSDWEFDKVMESSWEMLEMSNKIQDDIEKKRKLT